MADYLLKQLLFTLEPIGFVWLCLCIMAVCLWRRRQQSFALSAAGLALFMTLVGSTRIPDLLLASLERPYIGTRIESLPQADTIVLLGGGAEPARYEFSEVHLSPAGDRLIFVSALMRLGKAPVLILGGGGSKFDGHLKLECDYVRELLAALGTPTASMIPLGMNADTHEEALHARAVATAQGWNRILLVTSANHMRRASAVFRKQGFDVIPAPCNFQSSISMAPESFYICVPRHEGFAKLATWMHEKAGWWIYRWRGWVDSEG